MAIEGCITKLRETALNAKRDTRAVKENRCFKSLVNQATCLEQVHKADGALEGHRVKSDQCFFARFGFDVGKDLLLVINQKIARLVCRTADSRHE